MKTLPKLSLLRKCNSKLQKQAQANYQRFLEILLRTTSTRFNADILASLQKLDYNAVLSTADYMATAEYTSPAEHRLCNQIAAVIRKYPFPPGLLNVDPRGAALETFLKSERRCARINRKFHLFDVLRSPHEITLSRVRSWIRYVLGDFPSLIDIWDLCNFGPGASIGIHGNATNQARKILAKTWSVSPGAFYYSRAAMKRDNLVREYLSRGSSECPFYSFDNETFNEGFGLKARLVDYNNITFVPKTVRTERTIAVEPLLNGYLQKGVDELMRKKLKRVGIDLKDQSRNQKLAREGSLSSPDPYVTIDLSSASDSISIGLCRSILPIDWFDFLNQIRSRSYMLEGKKYPYEKFTTMGNGFCFPLETLIFASLCHVAYQEVDSSADFSVYGDDIIVRSSVAARVLDLLRTFGFRANPAKTFLKGPFRESCGADWFEGEDVRPINLDYAFDSVENIFKFCNLCRSKGSWEGIFYEPLKFLESLIPSELMFTRPYKGNVDTALEVPEDVFMTSPFCRWNKNLQSWSWVEIMKSAYPDFPVKRFAGYDVALMRGALSGSNSHTPFAERRKTCTKLRRVSYAGGWSLYLPETWKV